MPRRILILANPIAGGGRGRRAAETLRDELAARGLEPELFLTGKAGDAHERAAATAGEAPWDTLVSVGGDGTLNEVLNGMPDVRVPLAILPMGTANVLAVELRLPRKPSAVAAVIDAGHTRSAFIATATVGTAGPRRFLLFVGVGLDGAMVRRLEEVRTGTLGKLKWSGPAWYVIRRWPRFDLTVEVLDGADAPRTLGGLSSVLATRVRNYGGVFRLTKGIEIGDGHLHALCFKQRSRWAWIRASVRALWGGLRPGVDAEVVRARHLRIRPTAEGGDAPLQIDGEYGGTAPVELRLLDQPLAILSPAPPAARATGPGTKAAPAP